MLAWVSASANSQCSRERRRSFSRTRLVAFAWVLPKVASISDVVSQRALWVFAHTTGTGVTRMRNALMPSWLRGDVEVEAVGAADRERGDVGCEWVAGPVCRRSTVRQAIGLASGSGVALRMWVAPRIGAVRPRCLTQRRIDDVGSSVAGL